MGLLKINKFRCSRIKPLQALQISRQKVKPTVNSSRITVRDAIPTSAHSAEVDAELTEVIAHTTPTGVVVAAPTVVTTTTIGVVLPPLSQMVIIRTMTSGKHSSLRLIGTCKPSNKRAMKDRPRTLSTLNVPLLLGLIEVVASSDPGEAEVSTEVVAMLVDAVRATTIILREESAVTILKDLTITIAATITTDGRNQRLMRTLRKTMA